MRTAFEVLLYAGAAAAFCLMVWGVINAPKWFAKNRDDRGDGF